VTVSRFAPVVVCDAVILAPAMTAPDGSITTPLNVAVAACCALTSTPDSPITNVKTNTKIDFFIGFFS
jgi:hypothetical protein